MPGDRAANPKVDEVEWRRNEIRRQEAEHWVRSGKKKLRYGKTQRK